jgi:hypothetical protein
MLLALFSIFSKSGCNIPLPIIIIPIINTERMIYTIIKKGKFSIFFFAERAVDNYQQDI